MTDKNITVDYSNQLLGLMSSNKSQIDYLTKMADYHKIHAAAIANCITERLFAVNGDLKLPVMYLLDSIVKNVGGPYLSQFAVIIDQLFIHTYLKVSKPVRPQLHVLRHTWGKFFSTLKLKKMDVLMHAVDWEIKTVPNIMKTSAASSQMKLGLNMEKLTINSNQTAGVVFKSGDDRNVETSRSLAGKNLQPGSKKTDLSPFASAEQTIIDNNNNSVGITITKPENTPMVVEADKRISNDFGDFFKAISIVRKDSGEDRAKATSAAIQKDIGGGDVLKAISTIQKDIGGGDLLKAFSVLRKDDDGKDLSEATSAIRTMKKEMKHSPDSKPSAAIIIANNADAAEHATGKQQVEYMELLKRKRSYPMLVADIVRRKMNKPKEINEDKSSPNTSGK